jgi:hypothetical protein
MCGPRRASFVESAVQFYAEFFCTRSTLDTVDWGTGEEQTNETAHRTFRNKKLRHLYTRRLKSLARKG